MTRHGAWSSFALALFLAGCAPSPRDRPSLAGSLVAPGGAERMVPTLDVGDAFRAAPPHRRAAFIDRLIDTLANDGLSYSRLVAARALAGLSGRGELTPYLTPRRAEVLARALIEPGPYSNTMVLE